MYVQYANMTRTSGEMRAMDGYLDGADEEWNESEYMKAGSE